MSIKLVLWIVLFFFSKTLPAQDIPPLIEKEIQRRVAEEINPSISVGILLPDGTMRFHNYGTPDPSTNQKPDNQTLYEIGSVTKTFTSTLVGNHIADSLDASISGVCQRKTQS